MKGNNNRFTCLELMLGLKGLRRIEQKKINQNGFLVASWGMWQLTEIWNTHTPK